MASKDQKKAKRPRKRQPSAVDLFSGCGGLTLGLKQAGFNVVGAVEIDSAAIKTYSTNHRHALLKRTDIRRLSARGFRRELGMRPGELDLLAGCPPCQGFSTLRTRNGANKNRDRRNDLVGEMLRFAKAFKPKAVMMENVPRLVRHKPFKDLCRGLKALGYKLTFGIKNAAHYGVPQRRQRLILLAGRGFDIPFAEEQHRYRTVRGAIAKLSEPGRSRDKLHNIPEKRRAARISKLIRDIPKDGGSRSDLPAHRQLSCHKKSDGFKDIYGRMAWGALAPTITSGCFNPSKGRFLHPEKNRAITMREAALLQSFPRNYIFDLSRGKEAIALMIGNALPPEFVRRHAVEVHAALGRHRLRLKRTRGHARHVFAETAIKNHVKGKGARKRRN
jgi:DNA (cytosine-5)-methyltransferase 1